MRLDCINACPDANMNQNSLLAWLLIIDSDAIGVSESQTLFSRNFETPTYTFCAVRDANYERTSPYS